MFSFEVVETGCNSIDVLLGILSFLEHTFELREVGLRLLEVALQRSYTQTCRRQEIEIAQQHECKHEAAAGKGDHFRNAKHLSAA
jgi:hypothetical protein